MRRGGSGRQQWALDANASEHLPWRPRLQTSDREVEGSRALLIGHCCQPAPSQPPELSLVRARAAVFKARGGGRRAQRWEAKGRDKPTRSPPQSGGISRREIWRGVVQTGSPLIGDWDLPATEPLTCSRTRSRTSGSTSSARAAWCTRRRLEISPSSPRSPTAARRCPIRSNRASSPRVPWRPRSVRSCRRNRARRRDGRRSAAGSTRHRQQQRAQRAPEAGAGAEVAVANGENGDEGKVGRVHRTPTLDVVAEAGAAAMARRRRLGPAETSEQRIR